MPFLFDTSQVVTGQPLQWAIYTLSISVSRGKLLYSHPILPVRPYASWEVILIGQTSLYHRTSIPVTHSRRNESEQPVPFSCTMQQHPVTTWLGQASAWAGAVRCSTGIAGRFAQW